ncbi:MAG TPA: PQQ-dependent sugar dehydrogenase, partial [Gemmatimonadaceae bacterium]
MIAKSILLVAASVVVLVPTSGANRDTAQGSDPFVVSTFVSGLDTPWDLAWGPDSMIWVSERGGRISRVDPRTGARTTAGTVNALQSGEGGLMGIAFHPSFSREPILFAMHTYSASGGTRNKLVRMRWNGRALGEPETLLDNIPGGGIHNGSRIAVGPDALLYITTGDAGSADIAQDGESLGGKVLRLTLDGKPAPGNPFNNATWSFGHRNGQGLVFHPTTGALYETEQGPSDNDEVNIIRRGANYGWPQVHGTCDDDSGGERDFCRRNNVVEPIAAWTPTIAICGADLYLLDAIRGWRGSLLATSLRGAALYRLALSADGSRIVSRETLLANRYGRLRDVLVAPNGDVYVATSNRDGRG